MKLVRQLTSQAFVRLLGLLAFLGLGLAILGIPFLTAVPASEFITNPAYHDGIESGVLLQGKESTVLSLVLYGTLLAFALRRYLTESKVSRSAWLDSLSFAVLIYFALYISQVHTEWRFVNGLPPGVRAPVTQTLMPADRIAFFLVQPVTAFDDFVLHGRM